MTNKEAIEILKELPDRIVSVLMPLDINFDYKEAIDLAIKALKQEPETDILEQIIAEINTSNRGTCDYYIVDRIEKIINEYQKKVKTNEIR